MPDPWTYASKTRNEFAEQVALFMWAAVAQRFGPNIAADPSSYNVPGFALGQFKGEGKLGYIRYSAPIPELEWLHAIKNAGHGDAIRGAQSKAEGVKAGVPDIFLPVPMIETSTAGSFSCAGKYRIPGKAGLYIELKRLKSARGQAGTTSDVQDKWHDYLRGAGYRVEVCVGWELARDCILRYLGLLI